MKKWLRGVAAGTLVCFLATQTATAAPGVGAGFGGKERPSFLNLEIPADLATVDELYEAPGKADSRFILHIQDAHANYEAQIRIKQLLAYLNKRYAIKTVFVEGAAVKLDADYIRLFPDPKSNLKLADALARKGELSGSELYLLEAGKDFEALGIEDAPLYKENYAALKKIFGASDDVDRFFSGFDRKLEQASSRIFTPGMRELIADWRNFEKGRREFLPFVNGLVKKAKTVLHEDLGSLFAQVGWPQITRLLAIQNMEKDLNKTRALAERDALVKFLRGRRASNVLVDSVARFKEGNIGVGGTMSGKEPKEILPRHILERLAAEAGSKGFRFSDYPNFSLYAGYVVLKGELDAKALFEKIETLFTKLLDTMVREASQRKLLALYRDCELLRKLLSLELDRVGWREVLERRDVFEIDRMVARLEEMVASVGGKTGSAERPVMPPEFSKRMTELVMTGFRFYDYACRREEVFYKRIDKSMTERRIRKAVVITGGFHTDGLSDLFRENGTSYGVVTPRLKEEDEGKLYETSMLQNRRYPFNVSYLAAASKLVSPAILKKLGVSPEKVLTDYLAVVGDIKNKSTDNAVLILNGYLAKLSKKNTDPDAIVEIRSLGKGEYRLVRRSDPDARKEDFLDEKVREMAEKLSAFISLPAATSTLIAAAARSEMRETPEVRWPLRNKIKNILVVDDDLTSRGFAGALLLKGGFNVMEAASGEEAMEILKKGEFKPDAILTDVQMSDEMSGYQMAMEAEKVPGFESVPIVFISSSDQKKHGEKFNELAKEHPVHRVRKPGDSGALKSLFTNPLEKFESWPKPKILMVDDNLIPLLLMKDDFVNAGFDVQMAYSGEMALRMLEKFSPDAVLTDVNMPGMTGYEWVAKAGESGKLPVSALVAFMSDLIVDQAAFDEGVRKIKGSGYPVYFTGKPLSKSNEGLIGVFMNPEEHFKPWPGPARSEVLEDKGSKQPLEGSKETILIVDDDPSQLMLARIALEGSGFNIEVANSGEEALEMVRGSKNLFGILSDMQMPGMTGCEWIKQAFDQGKIPAGTQIVIASADDGTSRAVDQLKITMGGKYDISFISKTIGFVRNVRSYFERSARSEVRGVKITIPRGHIKSAALTVLRWGFAAWIGFIGISAYRLTRDSEEAVARMSKAAMSTTSPVPVGQLVRPDGAVPQKATDPLVQYDISGNGLPVFRQLLKVKPVDRPLPQRWGAVRQFFNDDPAAVMRVEIVDRFVEANWAQISRDLDPYIRYTQEGKERPRVMQQMLWIILQVAPDRFRDLREGRIEILVTTRHEPGEGAWTEGNRYHKFGGVPRIFITDDFFAAHSPALLAIAVGGHEALHVRLMPRTFMEVYEWLHSLYFTNLYQDAPAEERWIMAGPERVFVRDLLGIIPESGDAFVSGRALKDGYWTARLKNIGLGSLWIPEFVLLLLMSSSKKTLEKPENRTPRNSKSRSEMRSDETAKVASFVEWVNSAELSPHKVVAALFEIARKIELTKDSLWLSPVPSGMEKEVWDRLKGLYTDSYVIKSFARMIKAYYMSAGVRNFLIWFNSGRDRGPMGPETMLSYLKDQYEFLNWKEEDGGSDIHSENFDGVFDRLEDLDKYELRALGFEMMRRIYRTELVDPAISTKGVQSSAVADGRGASANLNQVKGRSEMRGNAPEIQDSDLIEFLEWVRSNKYQPVNVRFALAAIIENVNSIHINGQELLVLAPQYTAGSKMVARVWSKLQKLSMDRATLNGFLGAVEAYYRGSRVEAVLKKIGENKLQDKMFLGGLLGILETERAYRTNMADKGVFFGENLFKSFGWSNKSLGFSESVNGKGEDFANEFGWLDRLSEYDLQALILWVKMRLLQPSPEVPAPAKQEQGAVPPPEQVNFRMNQFVRWAFRTYPPPEGVRYVANALKVILDDIQSAKVPEQGPDKGVKKIYEQLAAFRVISEANLAFSETNVRQLLHSVFDASSETEENIPDQNDEKKRSELREKGETADSASFKSEPVSADQYRGKGRSEARKAPDVAGRPDLAKDVETVLIARKDGRTLKELKNLPARFGYGSLADVYSRIIVPAGGEFNAVEIANMLRTLLALKADQFNWDKFRTLARLILRNPVLAVSADPGATIIALKEVPTDRELEDMVLQLGMNTWQVIRYVVSANVNDAERAQLETDIRTIREELDFDGRRIDDRIGMVFCDGRNLGDVARVEAGKLMNRDTDFKNGAYLTYLVPNGMGSKFNAQSGTVMEARNVSRENASVRNLLAMKAAQISKPVGDSSSIASLLNKQIGDVIRIEKGYFWIDGNKLGVLAKLYAQLITARETAESA